MIQSIADLLNEFIKQNVEVLNKEEIKHSTSVGDMFEGLTQEVLNRSIFQDLNLKVVKNSFILGCKNEFDVLLVEGDGRNMPFTNRYEFRPEQVIAILQVKKNLYSKDISEGFTNLQFIIDHYENKKTEPFMYKLHKDSFRAICRKDIDAYKLKELTLEEEFVYSTLAIEAQLPVRILWGFNGFASEWNYRESFIEYLTKNLTTSAKNKIPGFGPHNFPNLIICRNFSMMKQNGMPFISPLNEKKWWPFYATSSYNPTYYILEAIWTRLSYKYEQLPTSIFGEDLTMEPATRFLDCRIKEFNGGFGWEYDYFAATEETLKENTNVVQWEPVFLDEKQHIVITELCEKGEIDLANHGGLDVFVMEKQNYSSLDHFIEKLKRTGLASVENNKLKLLTDLCQCVIMPDGRTVAGDNKTGRLTRWVENQMKKNS
jgi:hypothetical protein